MTSYNGGNDGRRFLMMPSDAPGDTGLGSAALRTLAALCRYRNNKTKRANPSTGRLAKDVNKSVRAVQKHLAVIIARGYAIEDGFTQNGVRIFFIPLE
jgi:hypothetical protein